MDNDTNTALKLGNKITIPSNSTWYVAGFDVEKNKTASDGTVYDNGYGIALVPVSNYLGWRSEWDYTIKNGYINSIIHTSGIPEIMSRMQSILGTHLINRNVLLGSATDMPDQITSSMDIIEVRTTAYTWVTSYGTCMSGCQLTGDAASYSNKYDDGEANYKLPLFDNIEYNVTSITNNFWLRGISAASSNYEFALIAGYNNDDNVIKSSNVKRFYTTSGNVIKAEYYMRPLIYIR